MANKTRSTISNLKSTIPIFLVTLLLLSCVWASPAREVNPTNPSTQLAPVSTNTLIASSNIWPTKGWLTSTPAEQGMDPQKLAAMLDSIQKKGINLHSLLIIRHGYIVSETYFSGGQQDQQHPIYSCTKSFISTLVGIAIDKGYIKSVDQKLLDFFPGQTFDNQDTSKASITLDNMLTMTSGLSWTESDQNIGNLVRSSNWAKFVLDLPMRDAPGKIFYYCTGCTHVLSVVLKTATGQDTGDYASQNLFEPLGIKDYFWEHDSAGVPIGGLGLNMTSREMAKLGYLYLHEGVWDGKQIVSKAWVKTATENHVLTDGSRGYGYQWWVYPSYNAYTALGMQGQTIFVIPSMDLVIVTTADIPDHQPIFDLIDQFIVPSILT